MIVLDDHQGVVLVAQPVQNRDQSTDIVRMQTGGRLIQDVKRIHQARAERPGETHAVQLAGREA